MAKLPLANWDYLLLLNDQFDEKARTTGTP